MNASDRIDHLIAKLTDWRGATLASVRRVLREADPEIVEEWKWMGSPVWSHDGIVCVGNAFKDKVKLTFYEGASLPDPDKLFNNGLDGNKWRTIDFHEGDKVNEKPLAKLVQAAVDHNRGKVKSKSKSKAPAASSAKSKAPAASSTKSKAPTASSAKSTKSKAPTASSAKSKAPASSSAKSKAPAASSAKSKAPASSSAKSKAPASSSAVRKKAAK